MRCKSLAALLFISASSALAAPTPFTLDLGHAYIGWEIDHFGYSNTIGQFRSFDGQFLLDTDQLENSAIRFTIDAASIDSNHIGRDNHLRAEDMLNVALYPTIEFVSTSITLNNKNSGNLTGELTFMGTTKPLTVDFQITDDARFAQFLPRYDQLRAIGFEAQARLDRLAHGFDVLDFPGSPLGQFVDLNIHFDLVDCTDAPVNNIPCNYGRNDEMEFPNE